MGYAYSFAINYIYVYREQHAKMRAKIVPARCLHVHVLSYCHLSHVTLSLVTVTVTVAVAVTVTVTSHNAVQLSTLHLHTQSTFTDSDSRTHHTTY